MKVIARLSGKWLLLVLGWGLAACASWGPLPGGTPSPLAPVTIVLTADGKTQAYSLSADLTVREALLQLQVTVGDFDRVSPPSYTRLSEGLAIKITRVTETYEIEKEVVPFTSEIVRVENRPEGERWLARAGVNGENEITYRTVFEDGAQVSRSIVKRTEIKAPVSEIFYVGSQTSFTLVPISGTLIYLNGRDAWAMRQNSGKRWLLTDSHDLDGRIFELSPDGQWLLYSRLTNDFNSLWIVPVAAPGAALSPTAALTVTPPISLPIANVPFYAEWVPTETETRTVAYSTAIKIPRAPGWQANNDLWLTSWWNEINPQTRKSQRVFTSTQILDTSLWGTYGWWGTGFALSPDGTQIAFARTDAVGLINLETREPAELAAFVAYNTNAEWAWFPGLRWGPDGAALYTVLHGPPLGLELPENSPAFDLTALLPAQGLQLTLAPRAGMFANPLPSPVQILDSGEKAFRLAYLQAVDPNMNSAQSSYRLGVLDRDGSNGRLIFPPEGQPGLAPNSAFAWAPTGRLLAVLYNPNWQNDADQQLYGGDLWLVNPDTGVSQQLTGDKLSTRVVWGK